MIANALGHFVLEFVSTRKRSCREVIFSVVCLYLFTGGGGLSCDHNSWTCWTWSSLYSNPSPHFARSLSLIIWTFTSCIAVYCLTIPVTKRILKFSIIHAQDICHICWIHWKVCSFKKNSIVSQTVYFWWIFSEKACWMKKNMREEFNPWLRTFFQSKKYNKNLSSKCLISCYRPIN